jgi:hypothetical protein
MQEGVVSMPSTEQQSFHQEVANRFGLVPNFFISAKDAPELIERLWDFAKAGYLDNPIPLLFKESLFVLCLAVLRGSLLHRATRCFFTRLRPFVWRPARRDPKHRSSA